MVKQQSELHGNMQRAAETTAPLGRKPCTKCGIEKELSDFNKCKPNRDGLMTWCRECQRINKRKWDAENAEHVAKYKLEYNIAHREEARQYTANYRERNAEKVREYDHQRKRTAKYKQQNSDYHARHYVRNKEEITQRVKLYQEQNPEKVTHYKKKNKAQRRAMTENTANDFTLLQWMDCQLEFDYKCAYCGIEADLEQDHVIPATKGGAYTKRNIVPACRTCNNSKKNKCMVSWFKNHPTFTKERLEKILSYTSQR